MSLSDVGDSHVDSALLYLSFEVTQINSEQELSDLKLTLTTNDSEDFTCTIFSSCLKVFETKGILTNVKRS